MNDESARKPSPTPMTLTSRDEEILRTIHHYRYMTSLDMAHLLFKPSYLSYVRSRLSRLSGGKDLQPNTYLCRFQLPVAQIGNHEKIFALGSKGRQFVARELGLPVDWYFRPYKLGNLSFSFVSHSLILTRFIVAAHVFSRQQPDFTLTKTLLGYELARTAATVPVGTRRKRESPQAIPDAWLLFERNDHDKYPILLEIDRGMEYRQKFHHHVRARIEQIRSGEYQRVFGTQAVIIAYATTGQTPESRETRRETMRRWTMEVLADMHRENWAGIFRFTSLVLDDVYEQGLFDTPVWFRPDDTATPLPLFIP